MKGEGDEARPSLCPSVENPDLVFQETGDSSPTHSRRLNVIAHKLSSLTQLNRADKMVPPVRVFPNNMLLVAPRLRGTMVPSRSKLHINYLELRWSFGPLRIPRPSGPVFCHLAQQLLSQLSSLGIDPPIWTMIQSVCHGRIWTHMPSHW